MRTALLTVELKRCYERLRSCLITKMSGFFSHNRDIKQAVYQDFEERMSVVLR